MADKLVGVAVGGAGIREIQAMILRAEELGIHAAWMTTGGARPDSMTAFAATAGLTENIKLGTSIVPTYPRHPLVMAQQAQIVAQLAPGRFRLGVGPSHRPTIEAMGIEFNEPLAHLREYLQILKAILQGGRVDFDGEHYTAHDGIAEPLDIEIMGIGAAARLLRAVRRRVRRRDKLDLPRTVPARRGPARDAGRGAAGRTGDAAAHRPRAGLRPR